MTAMARDPMCFSSHTTRVTPQPAYSSKAWAGSGASCSTNPSSWKLDPISRREDSTNSAASLARSSKDLEEHEYAVRSVADALEPHCSSMNVPEAPFVLHLPNVMHLATDVAGVVPETDSSTVLELAAALHPSAAVGGTAAKTELTAKEAEICAAEIIPIQTAINGMAATLLHPDEFIHAFVKLVVAHGVEVEADLVEHFHGRLVVEQGGQQRRGADHVRAPLEVRQRLGVGARAVGDPRLRRSVGVHDIDIEEKVEGPPVAHERDPVAVG